MLEMRRRISIKILARCGNRYCGVVRPHKRKAKKATFRISLVVREIMMVHCETQWLQINFIEPNQEQSFRLLNYRHNNQMFHPTEVIAYL